MFRLLTLLSFLLTINFLSHAQEVKYTNTIDVVQQNEVAINNPADDLFVSNDDGKYKIEFYVKHGKKREQHAAYVHSEKRFDKANFKWESRNKVSLRLYSSTSSDEVKLTVWGLRPCGTGMDVEM